MAKFVPQNVARSTGPITPAIAAARKAARLEKIRKLRADALIARRVAEEVKANRDVSLDETSKSGLKEFAIHMHLAFSLEDEANRLEGV